MILAKGNKGAVKKELCRLLAAGPDDSPPPVQRTGPGLYACFLGPNELLRLENPTPHIHALQLAFTGALPPPNGGSPPGSRTHTHAWGAGARPREETLLPAQSSWQRVEASKSWQCRRWFEARPITMQAFPTTGTLLVSVDSSDRPLDPSSLAQLRTWLEATLQAEGMTWRDPTVKTVEVNRDFHRVRLSATEAARFYLGRMGLSGPHLGFAQLEGALVQVYQKDRLGVMRQEIRLQPRDLDMAGLQAMVTSMFYGPLPADPPSVPSIPEGGYS